MTQRYRVQYRKIYSTRGIKDAKKLLIDEITAKIELREYDFFKEHSFCNLLLFCWGDLQLEFEKM